MSEEADIERLLRDVRASGDWDDEHEDILARWRGSRGEVGKSPWRWWWKLPDDDLYQTDCDSRGAAISEALRHEPLVREIEVIEARCWADDILAGDEMDRFAESRNAEIVNVAAND